MKNNVAYVEEAVIVDDEQSNVSAPEVSIKTLPQKDKHNKTFRHLCYNIIKRAFDIISSFICMIVLSPVFLIIAIAIIVDSKGKPLYSHNRIGLNGKIVKIYKFRSMVHNANEIFLNFSKQQREEFEINFKLDNDPRITRIGNFLRKTSLDELPQLMNIFKGDLSVVGPRPVVEYEIYKYGTKADKFLSVKPGLTGYWQVNGRNDTTYEKRVEMDMFYISNRSIKLDLKIIIQTIMVVFKGKGAY